MNLSRNVKYDFNNNRNYDNKGLKKSLTQIKFGKTENEKTSYSKNPKSNKYCSPIENQKSIYFFNNKLINNNNSESTKVNNKNIEDKKFRFVLDKYVIYKNHKRNCKNVQNDLKNEQYKGNINENKGKKLKEKKNMIEYKDNLVKKDNSKINKNIENQNELINKNINIRNEDDDSSNNSCNDLGNNINIKDLINLPFYIKPKYSNSINQNK